MPAPPKGEPTHLTGEQSLICRGLIRSHNRLSLWESCLRKQTERASPRKEQIMKLEKIPGGYALYKEKTIIGTCQARPTVRTSLP